jgi:hypothetical protein
MSVEPILELKHVRGTYSGWVWHQGRRFKLKPFFVRRECEWWS